MQSAQTRPPSAARAMAPYASLAVLPVVAWLVFDAVDWSREAPFHTLQETVAVLLALGVAAIALVRYYSRKSNRFLLLGSAFLGTAVLDGYHALVTSVSFSHHFAEAQTTLGPWSWLASRIFLSSFLLLSCFSGPREQETPLRERFVYLSVAGVALVCVLFFTFAPLPSGYLPEHVFSRPAELVPAALLLAAVVARQRRGEWKESRFETWLLLSLLVGFIGQTAFMPFSREPFDPWFEVAHLAKSLSYLCALAGLLGSMHALFRRADESAAELAKSNAALQSEMQERARAEAERDRFFSLSIDLLGIAGFDGYFKQLNPAWEKTLGFTLEELKARPFVDFVHHEDIGITMRETQKLRQGTEVVDFENRYMTKDGSYRWLSWRSTAVPEMELIYAVARDIDERKKVEQMKNDFVSVVSHELRTPLTSIRGALGLLSGGVAGPLPENVRGLVDIAAGNSERLVRLINDILDIEKIESGKMGFQFESLELMPLLEQAIESNRAYSQSYGVDFRLARPLPGARVLADGDRLQQVLANLLSNAVKFSPRGTEVEVAATRQGDRVRVAVTDHGPGISPDFQARIFEKFAQADASSTRQKGGTGLGLSISKAIVERHGGEIWFETAPGEGATFFFELPELSVNEGAPEAIRGAGILICEDDPDVARLLCLLLEREGYRTDVAYDADQAKRLLRERSYAAMTLDLMLPGQDGISLIRELRQAGGRPCRS